jgi:methionyl-tRNA formyltransferase
MRLRMAFMGSPDFAVPSLAALLEAGQDIACVFTQPPRPAGRGQTLRPTPVQRFAESHGLMVRSPKGLRKPEVQEAFSALELDVAAVVAYGLILPKPILDAPRLGCINLHGSLLPRWRGAAPIQRAVMAGDRETGVQAMVMDEGLDTGPILLSARTPIAPDDTAGTLHDRLAQIGAPLLRDAIQGLADGTLTSRPQPNLAPVYAAKITPAETRIDWTRPASEVDCMIRGLSPYPGAWFMAATEKGPVRMKALMSRVGQGRGEPGEALDDQLLIACGEGAVRLLSVQREGRQPMPASDYLRGTPTPAGTLLLQ